MKLSDRVRPGSEAAPWVIEEIKRMEAAIEAKAAPVGERDAAIAWYKNADWGNECFEDGVVRGFQAGAAHQRQQAREVVMPDDLEELLTEVVDIHRRRGVVLTIHIEQIADILARLNKGAGSHE